MDCGFLKTGLGDAVVCASVFSSSLPPREGDVEAVSPRGNMKIIFTVSYY